MNGDRRMNLKSQKGSIALFVLIALLFYMGFLLLMYANNLNKVQTITEKLDIIKLIYAKNFESIDDVYNRRLSKNDNTQPIIKEIPNKIITNVTPINDTYEEYGPTGGKAEYLAFENKFASLKEVINYSIQNNLYGNTSVVINAYGNNGLITNGNKNIEIIRGMKVTNEAELNTAFATTGDLYVYVANNIVCTNPISTDNINQKLDLNNCTISYTKQNESFTFLTLGANASLTILDASEGKGGNIVSNLTETTSKSDGNARKNTITNIQNNGTLTIESGMVSSNINQILIGSNYSTEIEDKGQAILNNGTLNVNGGTISSSSKAQACTYWAVKWTVSTGVGIQNAGTINLNSGNITAISEASMTRVTGSTLLGETKAFAYGIINIGGSINNSNNVVITVNAKANTEYTYLHKEEALEIKEEAKTVEETGE